VVAFLAFAHNPGALESVPLEKRYLFNCLPLQVNFPRETHRVLEEEVGFCPHPLFLTSVSILIGVLLPADKFSQRFLVFTPGVSRIDLKKLGHQFFGVPAFWGGEVSPGPGNPPSL